MRFAAFLALFVVAGCAVGSFQGPRTLAPAETSVSYALEFATTAEPPSGPGSDASLFWLAPSIALRHGLFEHLDAGGRLAPGSLQFSLKGELWRSSWVDAAVAPAAAVVVTPLGSSVVPAMRSEIPLLVALHTGTPVSLVLGGGPAWELSRASGAVRFWALSAGLGVRGEKRTWRPEIRVFYDPRPLQGTNATFFSLGMGVGDEP